MRSKRSVQTLPNKYPVTAVAFADAGDQVYAGGLDNNIHVWELRKTAVSMTLKGHNDTVTGLRVSPDGTHLLSNAMDNILRMWDMRPYAPQNRYTAKQQLPWCELCTLSAGLYRCLCCIVVHDIAGKVLQLCTDVPTQPIVHYCGK